MFLEHLIVFLVWILYYLLHSLLASTAVKAKIGLGAKAYRLLYSSSATILFVLVMLYTASTYSFLIFSPEPVTTYLGLMLSAVGIFVLKRAFRQYSFKAFMGLSQEDQTQLNTTGMQSKVRHPLYTGTLMIFIGYFLFNPQFTNLIMLLSLIIYLPFGIYWEEKKLIRVFGDRYRDYKKVTPSLFPKISFSAR